MLVDPVPTEVLVGSAPLVDRVLLPPHVLLVVPVRHIKVFGHLRNGRRGRRGEVVDHHAASSSAREAQRRIRLVGPVVPLVDFLHWSNDLDFVLYACLTHPWYAEWQQLWVSVMSVSSDDRGGNNRFV